MSLPGECGCAEEEATVVICDHHFWAFMFSKEGVTLPACLDVLKGHMVGLDNTTDASS